MSQHTPSTQCPPRQASADPQSLPAGWRATQRPPSRYSVPAHPWQAPATHCVSPGQETPRHSGLTQVLASHTSPLGQGVAPHDVGKQLPDAHSEPAPHTAPTHSMSVQAPSTQTSSGLHAVSPQLRGRQVPCAHAAAPGQSTPTHAASTHVLSRHTSDSRHISDAQEGDTHFPRMHELPTPHPPVQLPFDPPEPPPLPPSRETSPPAHAERTHASASARTVIGMGLWAFCTGLSRPGAFLRLRAYHHPLPPLLWRRAPTARCSSGKCPIPLCKGFIEFTETGRNASARCPACGHFERFTAGRRQRGFPASDRIAMAAGLGLGLLRMSKGRAPECWNEAATEPG